jgi:4-hydroxy-tetrahydrodipicolinate reductase
MPDPLRIGIGGALGRMGQALRAQIDGRDDLIVGAVFDRPGTEGETLGSHALIGPEAAMQACEVIVDFSTARANADLATMAAARGGPRLVLGATGSTDADDAAIAAAASRIAIVRSGNYSLGLNVLAGLVEAAAARLAPEDWDVEILEVHHKRKVDAPSGTALMLGEAAARGRGQDLKVTSERGRDGITGARKPRAIGFASLRGGGVIGEHSVIIASEDEIVTLAHSARDRSLFARGALQAANWVRGKGPGLYDMKDVLGFRA